MSGNSGAWGVAMWKNGHDGIAPQEDGISLEGGAPVLPYLPTDPVGTLLLPPAGLGVPAVRSGDVAFAQRDGVVQFADYYEPRQLTFQVLVQNDDCPGCSSSPEILGGLELDGVSNGHAYTDDSPGLTITGDLDVRVHVAADDWTPVAGGAVVAQWLVAGNQRGWITQINPAGTLTLFWSADGIATLTATSTAAPGGVDGQGLWLRYTLDVDNGAGGRDIRFYISTDDGITWQQLGATVTQAGVTSVFNSTANLTVGSYNNGATARLAGTVFSVEVRNGINGTIIADPDFQQPHRYSSFEDDAGNTWFVVSPAVLEAYQAARLSARQKVSRLTQEWSRNCSGATLVLFTDCHNPDATDAEKVYNGPYLVRGRPRVAEVAWERSNRGGARVTLRFDAADARLVLANTIGQLWDSTNVQTIDADEQNLAPDADLSGLTMTINGATVEDSHPTSGGPLGGDGGPYFSRFILAANTTSPMAMALTPSGTAALPVNPGDVLSIAWWTRKDPGGGPAARVDWSWYNAGGGLISNHNGAAQPAVSTWTRVMQQGIVAPALAEFVQFRLAWSGTALVEQRLDFAQPWINMGALSTAPETVEIVGTLCTYPVISLFPTMTAPIIVTYGNHEFTYGENVTSVVDIDTRWGRAADGFTDVTENLEGDFSSPLEPGIHEITVQTANPADTGFVNVVWENAVVSG